MSSLDSMYSFPSVTIVDSSTSSVQSKKFAKSISSLSLSSVFYVLNFFFSLLSVSKITRTVTCSVKLYPKISEFQEFGMKKMINTGHEKDRLYYLDQITIGVIQFNFPFRSSLSVRSSLYQF